MHSSTPLSTPPAGRKVYENPAIGDKAVLLQPPAKTGGAAAPRQAMKKDFKTFAMLVVAFVISMTYQYYRATLHEHPADTFGATEMVGYGICLGWSCLALVGRKWAVKAVVALCVLQLCSGLFYYFPVVFPQRHGRFWDWAEAVVFIGLIGWAGYRSVAGLVPVGPKRSHPETAPFDR